MHKARRGTLRIYFIGLCKASTGRRSYFVNLNKTWIWDLNSGYDKLGLVLGGPDQTWDFHSYKIIHNQPDMNVACQTSSKKMGTSVVQKGFPGKINVENALRPCQIFNGRPLRPLSLYCLVDKVLRCGRIFSLWHARKIKDMEQWCIELCMSKVQRIRIDLQTLTGCSGLSLEYVLTRASGPSVLVRWWSLQGCHYNK